MKEAWNTIWEDNMQFFDLTDQECVDILVEMAEARLDIFGTDNTKNKINNDCFKTPNSELDKYGQI